MVLGSQAPLVEASLGFYYSGLIQTNKQTWPTSDPFKQTNKERVYVSVCSFALLAGGRIYHPPNLVLSSESTTLTVLECQEQ